MKGEMKPITTEFAYVYVMQYHDLRADYFKQLHCCRPLVCVTFEDALARIRQRDPTSEVKNTSNPELWQVGNYWIEKCPIMDGEGLGLELESQYHDGKSPRLGGRLPIVFEDLEPLDNDARRKD